MDTVAQVSTALEEVLIRAADRAAWLTGFVQRDSKLTGSAFVQTLVLGYLHEPQASFSHLAGTAAQLGVAITAQGLYQRFGATAAACLLLVLGAAARQVVLAEPTLVPLLLRFRAVWIQDSTTLTLPATLRAVWEGCGGGTAAGTTAAVKLQVQFDLCRGALRGPELHAGRTGDQEGALVDTAEPGSLQVRDLGYFSLERFRAWSAAAVYWLSRVKAGTYVADARSRACTTPAYLRARGPVLDQPVQVGRAAPLEARLIAVRVPPKVAQERRRKLRAEAKREGQTPSAVRLGWADWTLLLTNLPPEQLSVDEALALAGARWQIELLFKLWKAERRLRVWHNTKAAFVLCEVYAKLLGVLVQHWLLLIACWHVPERSLTKAARVLRGHLGVLLGALRGRWSLPEAVEQLTDGLAASARMTARRRYPNTYQRLRDPTLPWLFRERRPARPGRKPTTTRRKVA
jgi:hypothetical protein